MNIERISFKIANNLYKTKKAQNTAGLFEYHEVLCLMRLRFLGKCLKNTRPTQETKKPHESARRYGLIVILPIKVLIFLRVVPLRHKEWDPLLFAGNNP